jgi:putative chitinase
MISLLAVQAICNSRHPTIELVHPFLVDTIAKNDIDTPLRTAMFIAQGAWESKGFTDFEEDASGQAYENRKDLGNVNPGDGVKYKGRGVFEVTGADNYAKLSKYLFGFEDILLKNPERLTEPELAASSAGWFWSTHNLNKPADAGDVVAVTKRINGGTNGLAGRIALYKRACFALGVQ